MWSGNGQVPILTTDVIPLTAISGTHSGRSPRTRTSRNLRTSLNSNRCVWSNIHHGNPKAGVSVRRSAPYNHYHHPKVIMSHHNRHAACIPPSSSTGGASLWSTPDTLDTVRSKRFTPVTLSQRGNPESSKMTPALTFQNDGEECHMGRYFSPTDMKTTNTPSNSTDFTISNGISSISTSKHNSNMIGSPIVILNPKEPREMFIGGAPTVALPLWAYKKCLTMVRGEPHELGPRLCLRLLQSLFSLRYLVTHNYNGSGGKAPIDPVVMGAVLRQAQIQFGSGYFFTEPMALGKLRDYLNNAFRVMAFRQRKGERVRSPFWNDQGEPVHGLEAPVEFAETWDVVVLTEYGKSSWKAAAEQLALREELPGLNSSTQLSTESIPMEAT